jgi:hypothetical protein
VTIDYLKFLNRERLAKFELFANELNNRSLALLYGKIYNAPDKALELPVEYYHPLILQPPDQRDNAINVIDSAIAMEDKALSAAMIHLYGGAAIAPCLTGEVDLSKAHVDFTRVYEDQAYVEELRANVIFARSVGIGLWGATELHTSVQTSARNYCREKYKNPERKAESLDLVEWLAYLKKQGWITRICEAKSLEQAVNIFAEPKGLGAYFAGNCTISISHIKELSYSEHERFCTVGKGAAWTLEWLFEDLYKAGHRVKHLDLVLALYDAQEKILPLISNISPEFRNMTGRAGQILKADHVRLSCSNIETVCCQYSAYTRLLDNPKLISRRSKPAPDLLPIARRKAGNWPEAPKTRLDLFEF